MHGSSDSVSRVLIELNLMESPWAYSLMAVTILIDAYLLYIFFTVQKAASRQSQILSAPLTPGDRSDLDDRISSDMTEFPRDRGTRPHRVRRC